MLEQTDGLSLHELIDHVAEDSADGVEPLVGVTNISQACLVQENFLNNEDGHSFRELRTRLHDAETKGNNLRR